jgi:diguanylate cyclase (GGDEF)-like protein/PAS domain S-box-containing protein
VKKNIQKQIFSGSNSSFYKNILDQLYDGVYFVDPDRKITYWNKGAERISGYTSEEVLGHSCRDNLLVHVDCKGISLCTGHCPLAHTIADGQVRETEAYLQHRDGYRVPVVIRTTPLISEDQSIIGGIEVFSDNSKMITSQKQISVLEETAKRDSLTGAFTRQYVRNYLERLMNDYENEGLFSALLFLDIDHFKRVNDQYGHPAGDSTLKTIVQTLCHNVRANDVVGRWGGEEFLVVLNQIQPDDLLDVANKLRSLIEKSTTIFDYQTIAVTVSIGATMIHSGDTVDHLIQLSDSLMYRSKAAGRNQVTIAL